MKKHELLKDRTVNPRLACGGLQRKGMKRQDFNNKEFYHKFSAIICFGVGLLLAKVATGAPFTTPVALTGATVVPAPGEVLEDATILIDAGRVVKVGVGLRVPKEAEAVDMTGLWVYPGFIDAATHLGIKAKYLEDAALERLRDDEQEVRQGPRTSMQLANRNGVWPHLGVGDFYAPDKEKLEMHRKAGFTTALITPHPAILGGRGALMQLSGAPLRRAVLQDGLTQIISLAGAPESGDHYKNAYPNSRMGVTALIRQTFLDASWYRKQTQLAAGRPQHAVRPPVDPVLEAVSMLIDSEQTLLVAANGADEIHHALDLASELDLRLVVLGGAEAWKVAGRLVDSDVAVIASLDWKEKPELAQKSDKAKDEEGMKEKSEEVTDRKPKEEGEAKKEPELGLTRSWEKEWEDDFFEPLSVREEKARRWEEQVNNVRVLLEAGVKVAVTGTAQKSPDKLLSKLREALELDLPAEQMLAVLTVNPAEIFGVSEQLGTIAPGRIANLTVTTHPLVEKEAKVRYTFIDGERFDFDGGKPDKKPKKGTEGEKGKAKEGDGDAKEDEKKEGDDDAKEKEVTPEDRHPWLAESEEDRTPPMLTNGNVMLRNATVLTVTSGTLEDTDVLVRGGKIKKIGRDLKLPEKTMEIDLRGYWLMPGIVDPHTHIAARSINEGTQSVTPEVQILDVVDHQDVRIHRALAGGATTILLLHGSANTIGGESVVLKLKYGTSPAEMKVTKGPRHVKFALGENVTHANSRGPAYRFPHSRMGVESVLRQSFNDAIEYRAEWGAYEKNQRNATQVPRYDLRLEALSDILAGDIWIHSHGYRSDELLRLLAVAEDYGVRVACFHHVLEGYRILPEMRRHGVAGSTFADFWAYKMEAYQGIPQNAAMMMRAGIVSSVNSDGADVIRRLNTEAAKSMRYGGLTADEALRLITINPAIQVGLDKHIGSIEEGKDADFAVFTRHPLDTFSRNVLTLIDGEVYFRHRDLDLQALSKGPGSTWIPTPPRGLLHIPENKDGRYAIVGAMVHPVSAAPVENAKVIIQDGKITQWGAGTPIPMNTTVIDATGLHVYPGLINAAGDFGLVEIYSTRATVDSDDIAKFQPANRTLSAVHPHSLHVEVVRAEGITTAATLPSGGVISGQGTLIQLDGWTLPEMLRKATLGLVMKLPSLPNELNPEKKDELLSKHQKSIQEIEAFITKAQHYARVQALGRNVEVRHRHKDVQLEAMIPYVEGRAPVLFRANTYKGILEALRFAETFALQPIILGGRDAWKCSSQLAEADVPVIITSVFDLPQRYDRFDAMYANAGRLEHAGVRFCIANPYATELKELPLYAGMAVAHGLSEAGAVRSITLSAAEILGVDDAIGSIDVGKTADLIITTGHPSQANTRTVASFIGGHPVELTSHHERNYEKFSARPEPELDEAPALRGPPPMRVPKATDPGGIHHL